MAASAIAGFFTASGIPEVEIQSCFYELKRSVDQKGRPSAVTQGGIIVVEIVSAQDDAALAEWMIDSYKESDGKLEFQDDNKQNLKTVDFTKGRCIGYAERFDKTPQQATAGRAAMTLTLTISAETITINGAGPHNNNWDDKKGGLS